MANQIETINNYREQKKKLEQLAAAARKEMQGRYIALLAEAADILTEYKASFDAAPDLPAGIKAFTLASPGERKPEQSEASSIGKKIGGLRRSLAAAIKNQDGARVEEVSKQLAALGIDTGMSAAPAPPVEAPAEAPAATAAVTDEHEASIEF